MATYRVTFIGLILGVRKINGYKLLQCGFCAHDTGSLRSPHLAGPGARFICYDVRQLSHTAFKLM